jgi:hypothetical protein
LLKGVFVFFGFSASIVGSIKRTIISRCIQQVVHSHMHSIAFRVFVFLAYLPI